MGYFLLIGILLVCFILVSLMFVVNGSKFLSEKCGLLNMILIVLSFILFFALYFLTYNVKNMTSNMCREWVYG